MIHLTKNLLYQQTNRRPLKGLPLEMLAKKPSSSSFSSSSLLLCHTSNSLLMVQVLLLLLIHQLMELLVSQDSVLDMALSLFSSLLIFLLHASFVEHKHPSKLR